MAIKKLIAKDDINEVESGLQIRNDSPENPSMNQAWFDDSTEEAIVYDGTEKVFSDTKVEGDFSALAEVSTFAEIFEENPYKYLNTISGATNGIIYGFAKQSDGKIIVFGTFTTFGGNTRNYIVRLNADGTEDSGFYTALVLGGAFNGAITNAVVQSDGKIIIGGNFTSFKGVTRNRLVRVNIDASEDTTFYTNLGTGLNGQPLDNGLKIQPDGKILICGQFTTINGVTRNRVARLNADGTVDTTFSTNLGTASATNDVYAIEILNDNKIAIGGAFTTFNGLSRNYLTVRNSDGTEDATFYNTIGKNIVGGPNSSGFGAAVYFIKYHDSKILISGSFTTVNGITRNRLVMLNENGTIDTDFATNIGTGASDIAYSIDIDSFNNIFLVGAFLTFNGVTVNRIRVLNFDGTVNNERQAMFGSGFNDIAYSSFKYDDKLLFGGQFTTLNAITKNRLVFFENMAGPQLRWSDGKIFRYNTHENNVNLDIDICKIEEDTSFYTNLGTAFNGRVRAMVRQPDGKIIAVGEFTTVNGASRNRIVRINADGTLDTIFNGLTGTAFAGTVRGVTLQSDGKILLHGEFNGASSYNGLTRNRLIRLNSDGSEDTAFYTNLGTGFNASVETVKIQSDGKILVGGAFTQLNAVTRNYFVRLNSDGTVDTTHYTALGSAFNGVVYDILVNSDNSIVLVGTFTTFNGVTRNRIVKLSSVGAVDAAFYTNLGTALSGATEVWRIAKHKTGMIIIGDFILFNGNTRNRILRLNDDGTQDTAFYSKMGLGFGTYTRAIHVQADDKILIGGSFTAFNSKETKRIVRLNSDGSEDYKFNAALRARSPLYTTMEANDAVWAILEYENEYLFGGDFTNFDNIARNRIIKYKEYVDATAEDKSIEVYFRAAENDAVDVYTQSNIVEEI